MTAPTTAQTRPEHDADDLVTEEMVTLALEAEEDFITDRSRMRAALRAVAPMMIAPRALTPQQIAEIRDAYKKIEDAAVAAEREACAKLAEGAVSDPANRGRLIPHIVHDIAAAIRARGETP